MKTSRDFNFILLAAIVGLLAGGVVLYWSNLQVERLTTAGVEFAQSRTTRSAALGEAAKRLGYLKSHLLDAQRDDRVPSSYDEWSRQQGEARTAIATLRLRLADLEPVPASPVAPQPGLIAASQKSRSLGAALLADWQEFEQRGSGLTEPSRAYAAATLLPLISDELQPAIEELAAAEAADAEHKATAFPAVIVPVQRIRFVSGVALVAFLGLLAYALAPKRAPRGKLLSAALGKSSTGGSPPPVAEDFDRNVGAMNFRTPKILVAEQNAADSDTLSLLLTNAGFTVIGCDHGSAAREAIETTPFAILLLDLNLPGAGGLEILTEARRRHPQLPAILLCNPNDAAPNLTAAGPGTTEVVCRPLNPRTLLWSVSEILYPGENRESREYSAHAAVPDDEAPPAETTDVAAVPEPPRPVVRERESAPPPPSAKDPIRVEPPASPLPVRPPAGVEPVPEPTVSPVAPAVPVAEAVSPLEATIPAPAPTAPAEPPRDADSPPGGTTPGLPRKKMVRRKILPSD